MSPHIQVVTTIESEYLAKGIATLLMERRLAACCQVEGPIMSIYRWKETVETATEWRIVIKTTSARWPELQTAIRELHSYATPELIVQEIVAGGAEYLAWVEAETK